MSRKLRALLALKSLRKMRLDEARKHMSTFQRLVEEGRHQEMICQQMSKEFLSNVQQIDEKTNAVALSGFLVDGLRKKINLIRQENKQNEQEFERHRNWVTELNKELKIVEKLEEKERMKRVKLAKDKEKAVLDAWVVQYWGLSSKSENET